MIPLNQEQHLGTKAYILLVLRWTLPGIVLLVISAVLASFQEQIIAAMHSGAADRTIALPSVQISSQTVIGLTSALSIVSLLAILIGLVIARLLYRNYVYSFEEFDLRMKRGILYRTETSLSYRQIQDVDVDRPLIYQVLGLSKLTVITAGHEEPEKIEVVLEPIEKAVAEEIRVMLERKIGVQVVKSVQEADTEMIAKAPDDPATALAEQPRSSQ